MNIAVFLLLVTATACVVCTRPSYSSLRSVYTARSAAYLKTAIGLPHLRGPRPEVTSAARTSKAFIDLGLTLDHTQAATCANASYAGVRGSLGIYTNKEVFISPEFFACYLRGIWGPPDLTGIRGFRDIRGKTGILLSVGCSDQAHVGLWRRNQCVKYCYFFYFDTCARNAMYYLP